MVVDIHTHLFETELMEAVDQFTVDRIGPDASIRELLESPGPVNPESTAERLSRMDEWGIEASVTSFPNPEVFLDREHLNDPELYAAFAALVNDNLARVRDAAPGRLLAYATVPLVDPDAAIRELDRAIDDLGLQGVAVDSNVLGVLPTDERFRPFFEHADDRNATVFLHPATPADRYGSDRFREYSVVGFPTDTTLTAVDMIFSGFLEAFPNLEIILSHLGGTLPYLKQRLAVLYNPHDPKFAEVDRYAELTREPTAYLDEFWYDTAMTYPRAIEMVLEMVGDRVLFGSEYPFVVAQTAEKAVSQVDQLEISENRKQTIGDGNARDLLANI